MNETQEQEKERKAREWAAKEFGIPIEEVLWYHSGSCYDRIGVLTESAALKVAEKMEGKTVNGGFYHGMPLGGRSWTSPREGRPGHFDVYC
jgi:hypothetical protein